MSEQGDVQQVKGFMDTMVGLATLALILAPSRESWKRRIYRHARAAVRLPLPPPEPRGAKLIRQTGDNLSSIVREVSGPPATHR